MSNKISKNLAYNIGYQLIGIAFPLITSPYLSRILGAENLGIHSFTISVALYFMMFMLLGIANYGNRTIATVKREGKEILSKTFWNIYYVQLLMSVLVTIAYLIYLYFWVSSYKFIAILQLFLLLSNAVDITWLFYGLEDFKQIVFRNTLVKLLGLFLIFSFVHESSDLWKYTLINGGVTLVGQLLLWGQLKGRLSWVKIQKKDLLSHIKPILVLFIPVLAISIFSNMDKYMLGLMVGVKQVGFYDNANRIIDIPKALIAALEAVMLPRTSYLLAEGQEEKSNYYIEVTILYAMMISSVFIFGIISVSDIFSLVFWGEEFLESGRLIAAMAPVFVFSVPGNIIRTQYLIPRAKDKDYVLSLIIGALVNILLNCFLIKPFGAMGATISTVLAEFVLYGVQFWTVRRDLDFKKYLKNGFIFYLFGMIMYLAIIAVKAHLQYNIINLILLIVLGGIVYTGFCCFYILISRNVHFEILREKIKRKIGYENIL